MSDNTNSQNASNEPLGNIDFRYYAVAMLDILGQNEILRQMSELPKSEEESQRFIGHARASWGRVKNFRSNFATAYEKFGESLKRIAEETELPEPYKTQFMRMLDYRVSFIHFSDMFAAYVPIINDHDLLVTHGICGLMSSCGAVALAGLVSGVPLRGAIEVGIAGSSCSDDFYGPVLAEVHHLESKVARLPRVVVGPRLLNLFESIRTDSQNSIENIANKAVIDSCSTLIKKSIDGVSVVDPFGGAIKETTTPEQFDEWRNTAIAFVNQELERHKNSGNQELAMRYALLLMDMQEVRGGKQPENSSKK